MAHLLRDTTMMKLPTLVYARDYHDFSFMKSAYDQLKLGVRVEEIGLDENTLDYVAVVYKGRYPSKKNISKLLEKFDVAIEP